MCLTRTFRLSTSLNTEDAEGSHGAPRPRTVTKSHQSRDGRQSRPIGLCGFCVYRRDKNFVPSWQTAVQKQKGRPRKEPSLKTNDGLTLTAAVRRSRVAVAARA